MRHPLKNSLILLAMLCSLYTGSAVLAQEASSSQSQEQTRPAHRHRRTNRAPIFIIFDMESHEFYYYTNRQEDRILIPAGFHVRPYDLVYFRAVHFNPAKTRVKITYQAVAPNSVTLPSQITAILPTLPAAPAPAAADAEAAGPDSAESEEDIRDANLLHSTLASIISRYVPPVINKDDDAQTIHDSLEKSINDLQVIAQQTLDNFLQRDPTYQRYIANGTSDIDKQHRMQEFALDSNALQATGSRAIERLGERKYDNLKAKFEHSNSPRIRASNDRLTSAAYRTLDRLRDKYREAAALWRKIIEGTFFEKPEGPEEAGDSVGLMVWTVEESDATDTSANPATTSYKLSVQKKDTRNLEFAVSTGVFGSVLRDADFFADANNKIRQKNPDKFSISTGVLVHTLFPGNGGPLRGAFSFGITVDSTPKYLAGLSLLAGHDQRLIFTVGIIAGKATRLENGYSIGSDAPMSGVIPTTSVYRTGWVLGLSFKF